MKRILYTNIRDPIIAIVVLFLGMNYFNLLDCISCQIAYILQFEE